MRIDLSLSASSIRGYVSDLGQAHIWPLIYSLCLIGVICTSAIAQEFRAVQDGVEHAQVSREFGGKAVNINLLRLDLKKVRIDLHHADDRAIGVDTTSSMAKRLGAIAAINAGFFRLDTSPYLGDPVGLFMIDGDLMSEPEKDRVQLIINNGPFQTDILIDHSKISQSIRVGQETYKISGINRERKQDELIIYTPKFGRTTLTNADGVELVIVKGNIYSIIYGLGNAVIPENGYIISVTGAMRSLISPRAKKTDSVTLLQDWQIPNSFLKDRERLDVVTGVPQLIKKGKIDITWEQEKTTKSFVETRHPRTAVAKLKDGKFLLLTADGRTENSGGLDLYDLAAYLLELGAVDAMNLDGGGSTTMFVNDKVVNHPSDAAGERKVSDVLVVTSRKPRK